jgi:polysaccharide export outer membrane protein
VNPFLKTNSLSMKILRILIVPVMAAVLFSSCKTQQKAPSFSGYFENNADTTNQEEIKFTEPLIQTGDLLSIFIYSDATDEGKTDAMYNLINPGGGSGGATQGFLVDNDGNIQYPKIGTIKAEGLTKPQLAEVIKKKINEKETVLTNPTVIVQLLNFRVTILGEVSNPGPITLPREKLNILEAVGLAGDISAYGKKNDLVIIRNVKGKIEYGKIDLSSRNLFQSPYYYLRQNDVVLVNPNKNKAKLTNDQVFTRRMGMAFSIINTIALLYNIFLR